MTFLSRIRIFLLIIFLVTVCTMIQMRNSRANDRSEYFAIFASLASYKDQQQAPMSLRDGVVWNLQSMDGYDMSHVHFNITLQFATRITRAARAFGMCACNEYSLLYDYSPLPVDNELVGYIYFGKVERSKRVCVASLNRSQPYIDHDRHEMESKYLDAFRRIKVFKLTNRGDLLRFYDVDGRHVLSFRKSEK